MILIDNLCYITFTFKPGLLLSSMINPSAKPVFVFLAQTIIMSLFAIPTQSFSPFNLYPPFTGVAVVDSYATSDPPLNSVSAHPQSNSIVLILGRYLAFYSSEPNASIVDKERPYKAIVSRENPGSTLANSVKARDLLINDIPFPYGGLRK